MGGNWKKWGWDWWWSGCWEKGCTSQAAIAQIKAGHVRIIAITVQFMFVHHYFKIFVNLLATPWKLPPCSSKLWEVVATWLVVNPIWLSASKTSRRVGLGRNGLVDNDDNNQDLRPVLCLLRARPALSGLFVFFVWVLAKSFFVRDTQSDFWFVCFLLVNFSTLLLPNIMYIRQRQVGETIYNLLIRRYCEKE